MATKRLELINGNLLDNNEYILFDDNIYYYDKCWCIERYLNFLIFHVSQKMFYFKVKDGARFINGSIFMSSHLGRKYAYFREEKLQYFMDKYNLRKILRRDPDNTYVGKTRVIKNNKNDKRNKFFNIFTDGELERTTLKFVDNAEIYAIENEYIVTKSSYVIIEDTGHKILCSLRDIDELNILQNEV